VWDEDNWESLWENIYQVYLDAKIDKRSEHFIGTIITKQIPAVKLGQNWNDLIDGQQRLTTISILLKSLADCCKSDRPFLRDKINGLLEYQDDKGEKFTRIELCRNDMPYFRSIIQGENIANLKNQENMIIEAYEYFKARAKDFSDEDISMFTNVILERVPVISMLLSSDDDEQVIFDTINSLGVKLTTSELLKNYIFKDKNLEALFDGMWAPVFEADEETVGFWNKDKTSGRIIRTNIEVLLYCYLMIETQKEIKLEKLYKEYKDWLSDKNIEQRKAFLNNLKQYATLYSNFPEGEELNEIAFGEIEKRFFHVIENLSIATAYPLVLYIYKQVKNGTERNRILELLESYLIRRNICRLTTKNYNNLFISIIQKLDKSRKDGDLITADLLKIILASFTEDTNKFPDDAAFKLGFKDAQLSNQNSREILYCIALYQRSSPLDDVKKLSSSSYSVEHMMPVKWKDNWMTEEMDENKKAIRDKTLKTLGNLTLITKRLNSKLSNAPWDKKKLTLKDHSTLNMTVKYINEPMWNEEKIANRAAELFNDALRIWNY